jgi:hypothetical protein
MGRLRRWATFAAGLAVLVTIPVAVAHRPLHAAPATTAELIADVRQARTVAYSGLVEAHGDLSLPNLPESGGIAALVSGTTRIRVWWASSSQFRVDQLSADGETDTATDGPRSIDWDSTHEAATVTNGTEPLHVPQASDLLPPGLAERLAPLGLVVRATRLPATRVAGRTALGLRLTPVAATTTVRYVDIDVDQQSGLPLRVAVTADGHSSPSFSSDFLSVHIGEPAPSTLDFQVPLGAIVRHSTPADFVADANRYAPFALPDTLARLPRTQRVSTLTGTGGAATYGSGYTLLALLPMQQSTARQVIKALRPPTGITVTTRDPAAVAVEERIPLANVLAIEGGGRAYLLAGTVTPAVLVDAANQLLASPPPFRRPR